MAKGIGLLLIGTALLLSACGEKKPAGQVVATIDGTEVTNQEINAELQGINLPPNADRKEAQRAILQRIVERKLLAEEARKEDLDSTGDYVSQKMRLEETLLAQQYVRRRAQALPAPTENDLRKFMADNPNVFGSRQQLLVDQIRMAPPKDQTVLTSLKDIHSQDGVAAALTARNVPFQRGRTTMDTAALPGPLLKQITALPAGEPFVLPGQNMLLINTIIGRRPVAVPDEQARTIATQGWKEERFRKSLADKLAELRKGAKINYQPGFTPPVPKPGAAAPAAP